RHEIDKIRSEMKEAEITASDADLKVKLLKSEDDGLFYRFQNAQHEEALEDATAAKLEAQRDKAGANAARGRAQDYHKEVAELEHERKLKADEIHKAEVGADAAAAALAKIQDQLKSKVGERDKLKAAIDAAEDPVITAKTQLRAALKKSPELTQYWLTSYDNTVDRCQNCHA